MPPDRSRDQSHTIAMQLEMHICQQRGLHHPYLQTIRIADVADWLQLQACRIMQSLHCHHRTCVTARPLTRSKLTVCAQQSTRQPDGKIAGGLHSRRTALLSVAASLLAAPACAVISTSPYEDAKTMQYGLDSERLNTNILACCVTCFALPPWFVDREYNFESRTESIGY